MPFCVLVFRHLHNSEIFLCLHVQISCIPFHSCVVFQCGYVCFFGHFGHFQVFTLPGRTAVGTFGRTSLYARAAKTRTSGSWGVVWDNVTITSGPFPWAAKYLSLSFPFSDCIIVHACLCIGFSTATLTKYHKLGDLNSRNVLSHCPGGRTSDIRTHRAGAFRG